MNRRRFSVQYWLLCAMALGLGVLGAEIVVPPLIGDAYRGESLPILNQIITGQSKFPLEVYLADWRQFSHQVSIAFVILALAVYVWWLLRPATTAIGDRIFRGDTELSPPAVVWTAAWFGAVMGLLETLHLTVRFLIERDPARHFTWELVWMAPISSMLAFGLVGVLFLVVVRLMVQPGRLLSPVVLPVCVFAFSLLTAFGLLQNPRLRLATYAVILLSFGIAVSLLRLSRNRSRGVLRFMRLSTPVLAFILLAGLAIGLSMTPSRLEQRRLARLPAAAPGLPNVLLIILDTARARSLSLYGYDRPTTLNLEQFAEFGTTFDQAIATAPWTLPSHASMFTGRFPFEVSADFAVSLDDTHPTLAEVLREDGYATVAFVANYSYTTEASGLSRGFALYEDFPVGWGLFITSSWLAEGLTRRLADEKLRWHVDRKLAGPNTDDFLAWLSSRPDRPFFAFINYIDAHDEYYAPEPFGNKFISADMPPKILHNRGLVTEAEMEGSRAAYDGAIANIDHELGRLFETLRMQGILDQTIVIVTSDHGEQFGEHGLMLHTASLYMSLLHVPLVVVYPALVPPTTRVSRPVSIRDIPATVLELVRGRPDGRLPGESLSRFWIAGSAPEDADEETSGWTDDATPLLAEVTTWALAKPWEPVYRGPMKSLLIDGFHYIRNGDGVDELYDLSADPAEQQDLSDDPEMAAVLEKARSALDSILSPPAPGIAGAWLSDLFMPLGRRSHGSTVHTILKIPAPRFVAPTRPR